jgi:hypothetical protein
MTQATTNNATTTISHTAARSVQRHFHRRRVASFAPLISRAPYSAIGSVMVGPPSIAVCARRRCVRHGTNDNQSTGKWILYENGATDNCKIANQSMLDAATGEVAGPSDCIERHENGNEDYKRTGVRKFAGLDHYLIKHRVTMIDAPSAYDVKTFRQRCN